MGTKAIAPSAFDAANHVSKAPTDGRVAPVVSEAQRSPAQLNLTVEQCTSRNADPGETSLTDPAHDRAQTGVTVALDGYRGSHRAQNLAALDRAKRSDSGADRKSTRLNSSH